MTNPLSSSTFPAAETLRLRVVVPELRVADVIFNTSILLDALKQAAAEAAPAGIYFSSPYYEKKLSKASRACRKPPSSLICGRWLGCR